MLVGLAMGWLLVLQGWMLYLLVGAGLLAPRCQFTVLASCILHKRMCSEPGHIQIKYVYSLSRNGRAT